MSCSELTPKLRALRVASPPPFPGATPAARRSRFRGVLRRGLRPLGAASPPQPSVSVPASVAMRWAMSSMWGATRVSMASRGSR
ncbi:hypothetical protein D3H34_04330 [Acidovorax cavernicola]|uniref:Uncharacterized protein n=1 Tax=Acidovorax cavernicola TaxID=1675792 RepID=A0A9X8GWZ3_9BURK|nr:hypothetical protein D3H34_04330 [Acidovorax cavernicola]